MVHKRVRKKVIKAGVAQTAAKLLHPVLGIIFCPLKSDPSIIQAKDAVKIAPTIQKDPRTLSSFQRTGEGNISAPREKTAGTEPPMPKPPMTLHAISVVTLGAQAEAYPAKAFNPRE